MVFNNVSQVRYVLTLKLYKVCLFDKHLSGDVNSVH